MTTGDGRLRLVPRPRPTPGSRPSPARRGAPALEGAPAPAVLALLRAYEPAVRVTRGELFFPSAVEPYPDRVRSRVGTSQRIRAPPVRCGGVTETGSRPPPRLRRAALPAAGPAAARRPGDGPLAQRPGRPPFRQPGRLARVGLLARLADARFNASLLLRGTVPGGTAAAAEIEYTARRPAIRATSTTGGCSGEGGWVVLRSSTSTG